MIMMLPRLHVVISTALCFYVAAVAHSALPDASRPARLRASKVPQDGERNATTSHLLARKPQDSRQSDTALSMRSRISAFFINMPDRPERRTFALEQYASLGIRASRIEGSSTPDKILGLDYAFLRAVGACAAGSAELCLISEDDALFRPLYRREKLRHKADGDSDDDSNDGYVPEVAPNTTADPDLFFVELAGTLAALPGGANGRWGGLHLCNKGVRDAFEYEPENRRAFGDPWPRQKFEAHALYPGGPDVLLLKRSRAQLYAEKLRVQLAMDRANHEETPIDVLQPEVYSKEDAVAQSTGHGVVDVFAAVNPQLCQHAPDLSWDPKYQYNFRSSMTPQL